MRVIAQQDLKRPALLRKQIKLFGCNGRAPFHFGEEYSQAHAFRPSTLIRGNIMGVAWKLVIVAPKLDNRAELRIFRPCVRS